MLIIIIIIIIIHVVGNYHISYMVQRDFVHHEDVRDQQDDEDEPRRGDRSLYSIIV